MKTITLIALVATLCGCSKYDHTKPVFKTTSVPITGAFGWRLGEKLSEDRAFSYKTCYFDDHNTNADPILNVEVDCLADRTICRISGATGISHSEVIDALESKYGPAGLSYESNSATYLWQNGSAVLECVRTDKIISLTYSDTNLTEKLYLLNAGEKALQADAVKSKL